VQVKNLFHFLPKLKIAQNAITSVTFIVLAVQTFKGARQLGLTLLKLFSRHAARLDRFTHLRRTIHNRWVCDYIETESRNQSIEMYGGLRNIMRSPFFGIDIDWNEGIRKVFTALSRNSTALTRALV